MFNWSRDIGIDLGTANTLVYMKNKDIILREPSVVAIDINRGEVVAVGQEASDMIGRTPGNISVIRPMKNGVIADYETTATMIKYYLKTALRKGIFHLRKPNVVVCVPSGITMVEEKAVIDATNQAGARRTYTIAEPFAAAIGAGMPVFEPRGSLIVDIGGGTVEVAVISLGGIVTSQSIRVAGDRMDDVIVQHIRQKHHVLIGESTAEIIKKEIGSAGPIIEEKTMEVRGRDLVSGLPKSITITATEIAMALKQTIDQIIDTIRDTLERTPPELAADVIERGAVLSGGGAKLDQLAQVISEATNIPVFLAENPLECVAIGTGKSLDYIEHFKANPNVSSHPTINS